MGQALAEASEKAVMASNQNPVSEAPSDGALSRTEILPGKAGQFFDFAELWAFRDVLCMLVLRDLKLRYKQTILGVFWVVLQPLLASLLFAVIFGRFAALPSDGHPYLAFVFCGLLGWNLIAGIIQRAAGSLIAEARLITKVYFPRLLLPLASAGAVFVDCAVSTVVVLVLVSWMGIWPGATILLLPFFLLLAGALGVGASLWVSALNTRYRDFGYALPFVIQIWMFGSPVVYGLNLVPHDWRLLFALNPATGILEGVRYAVLGGSSLDAGMLLGAVAWIVVLCTTGAMFFRRIEQDLADNI